MARKLVCDTCGKEIECSISIPYVKVLEPEKLGDVAKGEVSVPAKVTIKRHNVDICLKCLDEKLNFKSEYADSIAKLIEVLKV